MVYTAVATELDVQPSRAARALSVVEVAMVRGVVYGGDASFGVVPSVV
jgi:hypothetical protein